jgi:hypothetical protein
LAVPFEAIFATFFVVFWPSDAYTLPEPSMASESGPMKFVDANNSAVAALAVALTTSMIETASALAHTFRDFMEQRPPTGYNVTTM